MINTTITVAIDTTGDAAVVAKMHIDTEPSDAIHEAAWNLLDCNDLKYDSEIGNIRISRIDYADSSDSFVAINNLDIYGNNASVLRKAIEQYADGFEDLIAFTANGYYDRTGQQVGNITLRSWDFEAAR